MPHVTLVRPIAAPVEKLWAAWDDYAHIARFNPNLTASFLVGDSQATGLGATRQCDLADGKNYIRERITEYVPNRRIVFDIYEGTLPIKKAAAIVEMRPLGAERSELTFTLRFTPPMGPIGWLMLPLMKPQFRKLLGKLVDGNQAFVERGTEVVRAA